MTGACVGVKIGLCSPKWGSTKGWEISKLCINIDICTNGDININILIGGEPNGKNQLFNDPQVKSIVIPIYKNKEKRIFEFGDRLNPPH